MIEWRRNNKRYMNMIEPVQIHSQDKEQATMPHYESDWQKALVAIWVDCVDRFAPNNVDVDFYYRAVSYTVGHQAKIAVNFSEINKENLYQFILENSAYFTDVDSDSVLNALQNPVVFDPQLDLEIIRQHLLFDSVDENVLSEGKASFNALSQAQQAQNFDQCLLLINKVIGLFPEDFPYDVTDSRTQSKLAPFIDKILYLPKASQQGLGIEAMISYAEKTQKFVNELDALRVSNVAKHLHDLLKESEFIAALAEANFKGNTKAFFEKYEYLKARNRLQEAHKQRIKKKAEAFLSMRQSILGIEAAEFILPRVAQKTSILSKMSWPKMSMPKINVRAAFKSVVAKLPKGTPVAEAEAEPVINDPSVVDEKDQAQIDMDKILADAKKVEQISSKTVGKFLAVFIGLPLFGLAASVGLVKYKQEQEMVKNKRYIEAGLTPDICNTSERMQAICDESAEVYTNIEKTKAAIDAVEYQEILAEATLVDTKSNFIRAVFCEDLMNPPSYAVDIKMSSELKNFCETDVLSKQPSPPSLKPTRLQQRDLG
tara:strand:- start:1876 stop:3504 length:1629 start_codon:yes stop_codon:yes gene_type:complete